MRLQNGVLRPETDNDVDLGASGAEFKDLYLDGVAYIDDIDGVTSNAATGWGVDAHIQNISVSVDFGREEILELGAFEPYHRYVTFPVEVTSEFETIAVSGDMVSASGNLGTGGSNLTSKQVKLILGDGTILDLKSQNKLQSVTYAGGDTGGGNATITYSYSNFNDLDVTNANTNNP